MRGLVGAKEFISAQDGTRTHTSQTLEP